MLDAIGVRRREHIVTRSGFPGMHVKERMSFRRQALVNSEGSIHTTRAFFLPAVVGGGGVNKISSTALSARPLAHPSGIPRTERNWFDLF